MKTQPLLLSNKEHTVIPDRTFPMNVFHLCGDHSRVIPPHWHDHLEWIAILKGRFRVQVDTRFEDLAEGDVAFINARQIHSAFPISDDSQLLAVVFNEALLRNNSLDHTEAKYIVPLLNHRIELPHFYQSGHTFAASIHANIKRMAKHYNERIPGYELLIKAALLASLGYAFQDAPLRNLDAKPNRNAGVIQPLLLYLSEHFYEQVTVKFAAQLCCVSPNYFCYVFKKSTGKTLVEYIHTLRIHEAEQLLKTRRYPIQQIALMVGYSNTTYFGRIFRKLKNMSPSEFMDILG